MVYGLVVVAVVAGNYVVVSFLAAVVVAVVVVVEVVVVVVAVAAMASATVAVEVVAETKTTTACFETVLQPGNISFGLLQSRTVMRGIAWSAVRLPRRATTAK